MQAKTFAIALVMIGLAGTAFADGYFDRARSLFLNEVQRSYLETKNRLDAGDTDRAKEACKQLHENVRKLQDLLTQTKAGLDKLGDTPLKKAWEDVDRATAQLNVNVGVLEQVIGKAEAKDRLSDVTKLFEDLGRTMDRSNGAFTDFGRRWLAVCDTCR